MREAFVSKLVEIIKRLGRTGDLRLIIPNDHRLDIIRNIIAIANLLIKEGVRPLDRVALFYDFREMSFGLWLSAFIAIILRGGVPVLLPRGKLDNEVDINFMLLSSKSNFILINTSEEGRSIINPGEQPFLEVIDLKKIRGDSDYLKEIRTFSSHIDSILEVINEEALEVNSDEAFITFSEDEKAIVHSSTEVINNLEALMNQKESFPRYIYTYADYEKFPVVSLLFPLLYAGTVVIPGEDMRSFNVFQKRLCITSLQGLYGNFPGELRVLFSELYREAREIKNSIVKQFLFKNFLTRKIYKSILRKRFEKYFPEAFTGLEVQVLDTENIPPFFETFLHEMSFPYAVMFPIEETASTITYSTPKEFIPGTHGKILQHLVPKINGSSSSFSTEIEINKDYCCLKYEDLEENSLKKRFDSVVLDLIVTISPKNLFITRHGKTKDLYAKIGDFIVEIGETENLLKNLPFINDCVLIPFPTVVGRELYLLASLDLEACELQNLTKKDVEQLLNAKLEEINQAMFMDLIVYLRRIIIVTPKSLKRLKELRDCVVNS